MSNGIKDITELGTGGSCLQSYSGGKDQEDRHSMPAQANNL
jgi:hypothetical protein